jgi:hypothetical protein
MADSVNAFELFDVDTILWTSSGFLHAKKSLQGHDGNSDPLDDRKPDCGVPFFRKIEWFNSYTPSPTAMILLEGEAPAELESRRSMARREARAPAWVVH